MSDESFYQTRRRWFIRLEWKLQDLWIGAFWRRAPFNYDLWICLVPCLPIHIGYETEIVS